MCCNIEFRRVRRICSAVYQTSAVADEDSDKLLQVEVNDGREKLILLAMTILLNHRRREPRMSNSNPSQSENIPYGDAVATTTTIGNRKHFSTGLQQQ